jgi:hypothetical protein
VSPCDLSACAPSQKALHKQGTGTYRSGLKVPLPTSLPSSRAVLLWLCVAGSATAAPFLTLGERAELFMTGTLAVRADDNIFTTGAPISDTIFDLNPGLELAFGKDSQVKGDITAVEAFSNYRTNTRLNTALFSGDAGAGYEDGKLKADVGLGYHELNQNTPDVRGLTRRDEFSVQGKGEVEVSALTSIGGGYTLKHTKYKVPGYADMDDGKLPINFYYKMSEKLALSAGYEFRDQQVTVGQAATDHFYNVGARGEFSPLLTGTVRAGLTKRRLSLSGDETMFGLDGSLSYELTPKTKLNVIMSNAPDTSAQGFQQKNFSLGGSVSSEISDQWKGGAGLNFRAMKYATRTDHFVEGNLGVTYTRNAYVNVVGSYTRRVNRSPIASGEFTQNVFSVAANLRY